MTPAKKEKPINTFAVLVIESEGKQVVVSPKVPGEPYRFLILPCPEFHLPAMESLKFLAKALGVDRQELGPRMEFGIIQQRNIPRVYFHPFRFELTTAELKKLSQQEDLGLVKLLVPEEYHESVDMVHTDILNSYRDRNSEAGK